MPPASDFTDLTQFLEHISLTQDAVKDAQAAQGPAPTHHSGAGGGGVADGAVGAAGGRVGIHGPGGGVSAVSFVFFPRFLIWQKLHFSPTSPYFTVFVTCFFEGAHCSPLLPPPPGVGAASCDRRGQMGGSGRGRVVRGAIGGGGDWGQPCRGRGADHDHPPGQGAGVPGGVPPPLGPGASLGQRRPHSPVGNSTGRQPSTDSTQARVKGVTGIPQILAVSG